MSFSIYSSIPSTNVSFGSIIPNMTDTFNIGTSSNLRFNAIYANNLYSQSGNVTSSDINKKTEIRDISDPLSFVMQLNPKSYRYKDGSSGRIHTGFIAQECKDLFCPNWGVYVENEGSAGLRYEEFVALNSGAIKQLNNRLTNVEQNIQSIGQIQLGSDTSSSFNLFDINVINNKLNSFENKLNNGLTMDYVNQLFNGNKLDINDIRSRIGAIESKMNPNLTMDYVNHLFNGNKLDISDIKSRLETIETKVKSSLTQEVVSIMNDNMYDKIMSTVDNKLEQERLLKERKAREVETVINNFTNEFRQQIIGLTNRINELVTKCTQLDSQSQNSTGELSSLVEKVNLLVIRCNNLENVREQYTETLKSSASDQTVLLSNFEVTFKQQMADLISRVETLSNDLETSKSVNQSLQNEFTLVKNILDKVNSLSSDIDIIRETHQKSVEDQLQVNNNFESSFRQQLLELVDKVNLLSSDLDTIKEIVSQSSKEQKSEELELINRLMEKINQLSVELDTIKETRNQDTKSDENSKNEEMELINSLMSKVNSLSADLDTFRESVKQTVQEQSESGITNFEDKFRAQMLDLIDKVNSLVLRCNELDTKMTNIPKPENKIDFEDSDSCGSSMMETLQERLYKTEQLLSKQDKMIKKLTTAVNDLLKKQNQ